MDDQNGVVITDGGDVPATAGGRLLAVELEKEMKKSFLEYSMAVIVARALPDVRDGLKPVHRRILYTMHENGLTPDKAYRKCADTVGSVLGRYHPHGDASVYDALVRMAQDFSLRYPLVDGHGNFGSIDGHPPAAYRYTEARMSRMSLDMMADIERETVDFATNYDDRLEEPTVLPSRFPNLLVNGSTGIAVGMATNIPPHNLREVADAICCLLDNPDAPLLELMEHIKGPDFPTGGIIMGHAGIRAAYATGRGRVVVRAKTEIEEHNGSFRIIISEIPYMVNKLALVKSMMELADSKRVEGIRDVVDYSSREGMRIVVDLSRNANPQVVLNQLFSFSQLQNTFGVILLALVDGVPRVLTLREMLEEYVKFQCEVITRRTQFELRKAQERAHIVEALKIASDHIDEVIDIIRSSPDIPQAKARLAERFGFDDVQASAIVAMRLGQLAGLERQKIEEELAGLQAKIAELLGILADEGKIKGIVGDELRKMRDKYGDERRTEISAVSGEMDIEDLIPVEDCVLTMTEAGYIKRLPADTYRVQKRGGRGVVGQGMREEDAAQTVLLCSSHDYVLFFTSAGRVYRLKCYEVPEGSRQGKGSNIVNLLPLEGGERVTATIRVPEGSENAEDAYLCMVTRQGVIKRTTLEAFANVRRSGLIALTLREGDELRWVRITDGAQSLLVATRGGMAIRFDENDVRTVGRTAAGVKALTLAPGDEVLAMEAVVSGGGTEPLVLTVSETGYGRLSALSDYRLQGRGGKGLTNYHVGEFGSVAAVCLAEPPLEDAAGDDLMLFTSDGVVIRMPAGEIRQCRRPSKGVRVIRLGEGSRVVGAAIMRDEGGDDTVDGDDAADGDAEPVADGESVADTNNNG